MDGKLYELMDWAGIEAIVYSEEDSPQNLLGAHVTDFGILIQAFIPTAVKVTVLSGGKKYPMELADEAGFYAVLIPGKKIPDYRYEIEYDQGALEEVKDAYCFDSQFTNGDLKKFDAGIHPSIYEKLGAHPVKIDGTEGVSFAVWAPNAMRVSVVGDFNLWDGRRYPMKRIGNSGIFELFLPDLENLSLYKFELKLSGGLTVLKSDPYANYAEKRPATASVVYDINMYKWKDQKWLTKRKAMNSKKTPMSVYELHLGSFRKPEEGQEFYNYRELAPMIIQYVKEMGYTHIELMPVMEHLLDDSCGYQVTGYYAPTSRYGTPDDFMYLIDSMHQNNIGVILDWVPAHFPSDSHGLASFDGTCLYEHLNPKQSYSPVWGTLIYNYGRPQVKNFLIANALFWLEKYHADGIRMDAVASMLYLDYGKQDGEWIANLYGGNENLEAVDFLKQLNKAVRARKDGVILIAEDSTAWSQVTDSVEEDGLGFDYKWNTGWMNDFLTYMGYDPIERSHHYHELIFSMVYAYSEKYMLTFPHNEVINGKGSLLAKMPGEKDRKLANLRVAYGYMMVHPGKKMVFMGQDLGQESEWSVGKSIDWEMLTQDDHKKMQTYMKELNQLYTSEPALSELDYDESGFTWINSISAIENILVFTRNTKKTEDTLFIVLNFSDVEYDSRKFGVPYEGKYKEIFNSDDKKFGGSGDVNSRLKQSKKDECDDRPDSIRLNVPPLGMSVLKYSKPTVKTVSNQTKKKTPDLKKKLEKKIMEEDAKVINEIKVTEEVIPVKKTKTASEKTEIEKNPTVKKVIEKKAAEKKVTEKKSTVKKSAAKKTAVKTAAKTEAKKNVKTDAEVKTEKEQNKAK